MFLVTYGFSGIFCMFSRTVLSKHCVSLTHDNTHNTCALCISGGPVNTPAKFMTCVYAYLVLCH